MSANWDSRTWLALGAVIVLAVALRIIFYAGFFGSDDLTYATSAVAAARGDPLTAIYIGAIRLGVNYPMAAFVHVFGLSEASLAAYGMVTSIAEIALVFVFAHALGGRRLAVVSALILALVPSHIHLAGRIMADSPLAFFITATLVAFFFGERRGRAAWYLLAGICAGAVFWIKQPTIIFLMIFAAWALMKRRIDPKWLWAAGSCAAMVILNFAFTWRTSGNLWLLLDSLALAKEHTAKFVWETGPEVYFRYLFLDLRHTALLGWLALAGGVFAAFGSSRDPEQQEAYRFLLIWAIGLLVVFSLFITGLNPLTFIMKQTNYMTIFLAPLAVLAGLAFEAIKPRVARTLAGAIVAVFGMVLAGLQQQAIRSFTANSRATASYAMAHPGQTFHVMTNAYRYMLWVNLLTESTTIGNIRPLAELVVTDRDQWVVLDPETVGWGGASDPARDAPLPTCWVLEGEIKPQVATAAGLAIASGLREAIRPLPAIVSGPADSILRPLVAPLPARLYRARENCSILSQV